MVLRRAQPQRSSLTAWRKSKLTVLRSQRDVDPYHSKPKSAAKENQKATTAVKKGTPKAATNGAASGGRGGKKTAGRAGRPKAKTADELDAEMADYFGGETTNGATTNGDAAVNGAAPAAAATNGGDGVEDVVM